MVKLPKLDARFLDLREALHVDFRAGKAAAGFWFSPE